MSVFKGCLLACDIDGTLMVNGFIPKRSIEKIEYFVKNGGTFALATGRSVGAVSMVLEKIKGIGPSVVANGCMIYDFQKNEIIKENIVTKDAHNTVREVFEKFPTVGIELHSGGKVYVLRENSEIKDHENYERLDSSLIDINSAFSIKWNKVLFAAENFETYTQLKSFLENNMSGNVVLPTTAFIDNRMRHYLEVLPQEISKASALDELCRILNIKKGHYYAIGDYYNDLEMIIQSDIGAVPIDSPEDIKEKADFITGTAESGAVADFIDYLTEKFS